MAQQRTARPVSGEIMTVHRRFKAGIAKTAVRDVVDAEFEVLAGAPVQAMSTANREHSDAKKDSARVQFAPSALSTERRRFSERGGAAFWIKGAALAGAAFWASGGHALVMPSTASNQPSTTPAITFASVTSRVDVSGAKPVILVDGSLSNDGASPVALPALEIRVADQDGLITRYKLGTSSRHLAAGEQYAFSSRLDAPKNGVKTVAVTFAE